MPISKPLEVFKKTQGDLGTLEYPGYHVKWSLTGMLEQQQLKVFVWHGKALKISAEEFQCGKEA